MLRSLSIRDIVLIESADLTFEPGLNVLTGETGTGKSILLDALGFVLGWRTRRNLLRSGAGSGEVSAVFVTGKDHPANVLLDDAGIPLDADGLVLRRTIGADARRQAWVNDRKVTAETMRGLGTTLVELHGQRDEVGLLNPSNHLVLLDAFAGNEKHVGPVESAWRSWRTAERALADYVARRADVERDADFVRHALEELQALDIEPGDEARLDERRRALRAASRISEDVAGVASALGSDGVEGAMLQALRALQTAARGAEGVLDGALDDAADELGRLLDGLSDAARRVESVHAGLEADPLELERVEERLFELRRLARKHQVASEELPGLTDTLRSRLDAIDSGPKEEARLKEAVRHGEAAYHKAASALSSARRKAAARLDSRMSEELPALRLDRAVFATKISGSDPGPSGVDRVRFTAATNAGADPGPIERIASGGELSRFLLALKVCLSERSDDLTLVFDEIDRGVGGATADAVGRRLQALGKNSQLLVVTHSPQVAACGAHHWRVGKRTSAQSTRTEVAALASAERIEEIARMLAGERTTDEARAAAEALLAS